jgi:hypothetical protein
LRYVISPTATIPSLDVIGHTLNDTINVALHETETNQIHILSLSRISFAEKRQEKKQRNSYGVSSTSSAAWIAVSGCTILYGGVDQVTSVVLLQIDDVLSIVRRRTYTILLRTGR